MTSLAWLAIPVVAVMLAIACVAWVGRTRRPADVADTVKSYARFQAALSQAALSQAALSQAALSQAASSPTSSTKRPDAS